jgi:hypothetical protein
MARKREGYNVRGTTIRRLLERGIFAGDTATRMAAIGAMTIDRRPLVDEPYMTRSASAHDYRMAQKESELRFAAGALWNAGERDVAFTFGERPDLHAKLVDGRTIGIEVSEIIATDSARQSNALRDLNVALNDAVDADATLWPRETYLSFNMSAVQTSMPASRERTLIVEAIIAILRDHSWERYDRTRPGGPDALPAVLAQYGIWLHVGALPGNERGYVEVGGPATSFDPTSLVDLIRGRIARKCALASGYDQERELWLLLVITDEKGVFTESVEIVTNSPPPFAPFSRLIITDGQIQRMVDA